MTVNFATCSVSESVTTVEVEVFVFKIWHATGQNYKDVLQAFN